MDRALVTQRHALGHQSWVTSDQMAHDPKFKDELKHYQKHGVYRPQLFDSDKLGIVNSIDDDAFCKLRDSTGMVT